MSPTAYSLLCDYFPPSIRTRIMSIFSFTIYIGEDIGLLIGIISQLTSWRISFFILGTPGLILSFLFCITVKEPFRGLSDLVSPDVKKITDLTNNHENSIVLSNECDKDVQQMEKSLSVDQNNDQFILHPYLLYRVIFYIFK